MERITGFLDENDTTLTVTDVYRRGKDIASSYSITGDREISVEEAKRDIHAFFQLSGLHADEIRDVANLSYGLPWESGRYFGGMAQAIADRFTEYIPGRIEWIGDDQLFIFIDEDIDPRELFERFIDAPYEVYNRLPNYRKAFGIVQGMRREDILDPIRGKGETFEDIFYGRVGELIPAFIPDGRLSMVWNYKKEGDELIGLSLHNRPQKLSEIANHKVADEDMEAGLLKRQEYFQGMSSKHRFLISIHFDPSVVCCRFSTNAQLGVANFYKTDEFISGASEIRSNLLRLFGQDELISGWLLDLYKQEKKNRNNICSKCNKSKNGSSEGGRCECKE